MSRRICPQHRGGISSETLFGEAKKWLNGTNGQTKLVIVVDIQEEGRPEPSGWGLSAEEIADIHPRNILRHIIDWNERNGTSMLGTKFTTRVYLCYADKEPECVMDAACVAVDNNDKTVHDQDINDVDHLSRLLQAESFFAAERTDKRIPALREFAVQMNSDDKVSIRLRDVLPDISEEKDAEIALPVKKLVNGIYGNFGCLEEDRTFRMGEYLLCQWRDLVDSLIPERRLRRSMMGRGMKREGKERREKEEKGEKQSV